MRVLVTGSAGYVGAVLVRSLELSGHDVAGVDTQFFRDALVADEKSGARVRPGDVRRFEVSDLRDVDAVVDLAALCNDPLGGLNPSVTFEVNHLAAVRTARLARQAGVSRFVFSSSCSIYGLNSRHPLTESDPVRPLTPYAEAKHLAEQDIARLADGDFSPTFLRNATAYGPSPSFRLDLVVNYQTALAVTRKEVRLRDDGLAWRPFVHVEDLCAAVRAVLEASREIVHNQVFNVGPSEDCHRIREIAELVVAGVPGAELKATKEAQHDARSYRIDDAKIRQAIPGLIWRKRVPNGISELVDFYQSIGLSEEDLASTRFDRLATVIGHQRAGRLNSRLYWAAGCDPSGNHS
ncbi:NAD-dependent epimerase/dehydratase family protein [Nonomuraea cavernae]|uniref:NAD-dependent epimerase/dehydratase family protein n=1 Tax=Nonomuraea cavernae TaxID=2045107 RepID=UPI0033C189FD